jgi:succinoglycan biosynthesis protein ExoL
MKIAFLCPSVGANHFKYAHGFKEAGAEIRFFCFYRKQYPTSDGDLPITLLGTIEHGKYLARIPRIISAAVNYRRALKEYDCIFAFNWEMAMLAIIAFWGKRDRPAIILQMLDIRPIMMGAGPLSKLFRFTERRVLARIDLLCLLSRFYLDRYYLPVQGYRKRPFFILENKMYEDASLIEESRKTSGHSRSGGIEIGYFGLIRCRKSCEILKQAVLQGEGKLKLYLRGISLEDGPDLEEYSAGCDDIVYEGEFQPSRESAGMFSRVDLAWIASPYKDDRRVRSDWRWKRVNRFYQSCFFGKPMIAWKDTDDGDAVEKYGIGLTVDPEAPERAVRDILGITEKDLERWRSNLNQLPREVYTFTDEHEKLYRIMQSLRRSAGRRGLE